MNKKRVVTLRLTNKEYEKVVKEAEGKEVSISEILRELVKQLPEPQQQSAA